VLSVLKFLQGSDFVKRKVIALLVAFAVCLNMSGCIALFSDTYHSETQFSSGEALEFDPNVEVVRNYAELRRYVFGLVNNHVEFSEVLFSGYAGNAVSDIASVCNAVKTESAYGAYCVDYVAYDMTQIVSSYEASITISYKYTAEELETLMTTSNHDSLSEIMAQELESETDRVVVKVNNGTSDSAAVLELMDQIMRNHPLAISYYPGFSVKIYSSNSSQRIYEMSITYDEAIDNVKRLDEMNTVLTRTVQLIESQDSAQKIAAAAVAFAALSDVSNIGGDTAYAALVEGLANSEGAACAFKALCDKLEIECMVVSGRMGKNEHYWNIVKVDNDYYHVDVSVMEESGAKNALFLRDADKQVDCWWDQSEYPDCDGKLTYAAVMPT